MARNPIFDNLFVYTMTCLMGFSIYAVLGCHSNCVHTHIYKKWCSQSYTGYTPNVLPDYHCAAPHSIIWTTRKFSLLLVWVSRVCMDIILICLLFDADGALQPGHDIIPNIRVRLKSGLAPSSFWTELCCILPRPNSSATNWSSLRAGISKFGLCTNHTQLSSIYKY